MRFSCLFRGGGRGVRFGIVYQRFLMRFLTFVAIKAKGTAAQSLPRSHTGAFRWDFSSNFTCKCESNLLCKLPAIFAAIFFLTALSAILVLGVCDVSKNTQSFPRGGTSRQTLWRPSALLLSQRMPRNRIRKRWYWLTA